LSLAPMKDQQGQRFLREATLLASLNHPHLIRVFNIGQIGQFAYYAMEFLHGPSLREIISDLRDGPQPNGPADHFPGAVLRIDKQNPFGPFPLSLVRLLCEGFAAVADAVGYIHCRHIVHLDITTNNIMVNFDGRMILLDFGLARLLSEPVEDVGRAKMGTPRFMAPEQITRQRQHLDERTDVYGLGVTLCELLTLQPVVPPGNLDEMFNKIKTGDINPPSRYYPEFPKDLEAILLRAISLRPEDRYSTAQEMAEDIYRYLDGESVQAPLPRRRSALRGFWITG